MLWDIRELAAADNAAALALWEASVRASHHYVAEDDVLFYRGLVAEALLQRPMAFYGLYTTMGGLRAFMALDAGQAMLEMLFVLPEDRGRGYGTALVRRALALGARRVDVNEQNTAARVFYTARGFVPTARSAEDGTGRPYPLLHMEFIPPPLPQAQN